jgi:hypothetical protein
MLEGIHNLALKFMSQCECLEEWISSNKLNYAFVHACMSMCADGGTVTE